MTSGNRSEEPIARDDADALERLGPLADGFLVHDRAIHTRVDDSVVRVVAGVARPLRRAAGLRARADRRCRCAGPPCWRWAPR